MHTALIYLLLVKATLTTFSGFSSIPVVRNDFVVRRHFIDDRQLNLAIAAARLSPGPNGIYIVNVGYFADGLPGAVAGWLAMITPAFLILPMLAFLGTRAKHPRVRSMIRSTVLASAGLIISAAVPLGANAVTSPALLAIAAVGFALTAFTRIDSLWIMLGAAAAGVCTALF